MTRARDVANVLSTATSLATDTETAAAISSHNTAANGHVGRGTTGNRPGSPATGDLYYDTTINNLIRYNGTSWVEIAPVPNAPTNVVATLGSPSGSTSNASISFTAPTNTSVSSYIVTSSPGNITASGSSSPVIISGLQNGSSYTFTVIAQNSNGNSASSSASNSITAAGPKADGGTITELAGHWVHTFTSSGIFATSQSISAQVMIVAGGGGGSDSPALGGRGGGGGAGGLLYYGSETPKTPNGSALSLSAQSYTVTVGAGGVRSIQTASIPQITGNGNNSVFGAYTAIAGGGAGPNDNPYGNGQNGGSGGGSWYGGSPGNGTAGQGNNGGSNTINPNYGGGGGGGAGAAGGNGNTTTGGSGGNGLQYSINGTATYYAGGGSADIWSPSGQTSPGTAGLGGGGAGRNNNTSYFSSTNGTANTGGGGGSGGLGGSGIVIVRYAK